MVNKSVRYALIPVFFLAVSGIGCVSPEAVKVEVADQLRAVKASLNADVDAKVTAASTEMQQRISAGISQQNNGMFSGGGLYVVAAALGMFGLLVFAVVAIIYIWLKLRNVTTSLRSVSADARAMQERFADDIHSLKAKQL